MAATSVWAVCELPNHRGAGASRLGLRCGAASSVPAHGGARYVVVGVAFGGALSLSLRHERRQAAEPTRHGARGRSSRRTPRGSRSTARSWCRSSATSLDYGQSIHTGRPAGRRGGTDGRRARRVDRGLWVSVPMARCPRRAAAPDAPRAGGPRCGAAKAVGEEYEASKVATVERCARGGPGRRIVEEAIARRCVELWPPRPDQPATLTGPPRRTRPLASSTIAFPGPRARTRRVATSTPSYSSPTAWSAAASAPSPRYDLPVGQSARRLAAPSTRRPTAPRSSRPRPPPRQAPPRRPAVACRPG